MKVNSTSIDHFFCRSAREGGGGGLRAPESRIMNALQQYERGHAHACLGFDLLSVCIVSRPAYFCVRGAQQGRSPLVSLHLAWL